MHGRPHPSASRAYIRLLLLVAATLTQAGCAHFRGAADDPLRPDMVKIRGGVFEMGAFADGTNADAVPIHRVRVRSFRLARFEVTFDQYDAFARATGRPLPPDDGFGRGRRAVSGVTWDDAHAFCSHYGYRLPTEAEWEYAARDRGRPILFAGTNDPAQLSDFAFYSDNSLSFSHHVGLKKPNELGLHDMSGNVAEWVGAYYERYPRRGDTPVYKDLSRAGMRVARGGSLNSTPDVARTYWRAGTLSDIASFSIGFRCAR